MQHDEAMTLLEDFSTGLLAANLAMELQAHISECEACRQVLEIMRELGDTLDEHGSAMFDEHPHSEELVALAEQDKYLDRTRLAQIRSHLQICPTCRRELEISQRALRADLNPVRRLRDAFERPGAQWALAAGIVFVLAAVGKLSLDSTMESLRLDNRMLIEQVKSAEEAGIEAGKRLVALEGWSGALSSLLVSAPLRDSNGNLISVALESGQPYLPLLFDFEPGITASEVGLLEVKLFAVDKKQAVWQIRGYAADWWDPSPRVLSLSLPTSNLEETTYRLELREAETSRLLRETTFKLFR